MHDRLVPNSARFPDQTIDDETLLFDAETGHLLLLTGFGSVLWTQLAAGAGPAELCELVEQRFGAEAALASRTFLDDLRAADILVASGEPAPAAGVPPQWPAQFTAPGIERYDDIAKIIAMDPIHDVDATTGWPRVAADKT
jgi:hypothetical protein